MEVVYRIQDWQGRGPWKPGFSVRWSDSKYPEEYSRLPTWMDEFGRVDKLVLPQEWSGTACSSVEQARLWFTPAEYSRLIYFKYKFVSMLVDRVLAMSDVQLYFARSKPLNVDFTVEALY